MPFDADEMKKEDYGDNEQPPNDEQSAMVKSGAIFPNQLILRRRELAKHPNFDTDVRLNTLDEMATSDEEEEDDRAFQPLFAGHSVAGKDGTTLSNIPKSGYYAIEADVRGAMNTIKGREHEALLEAHMSRPNKVQKAPMRRTINPQKIQRCPRPRVPKPPFRNETGRQTNTRLGLVIMRVSPSKLKELLVKKGILDQKGARLM